MSEPDKPPPRLGDLPDDADERLPLQVVDRHTAPVATGRRSGLRRLWLLPALMLTLAGGGLIGLYFQPPGLQKLMTSLGLEPGAGTRTPIAVRPQPPQRQSPDPAAAPDAVLGLGALLPRGQVITVAAPSGAGGARIDRLQVDEGDRVVAGQVLAVLDNEDRLKAAAAAMRARLALRQADLEKTRTTVRASLSEARAELARVQAAAEVARREYARNRSLSERGLVSNSVMDEKSAARDQALRAVDAAAALLSRFETDDPETQVDVVVAARELASAQAELRRAESELQQAYVRAPSAGTVLAVHARPGETLGGDGLLNLGDIDHMMAEVEVYQTEVGRVRPGQRVRLSADALPTTLHGRVARVGLEVGRQTLVGEDPAANTDARVVTVTVDLDPTSSALASRFTRLQVIARIDVKGES